jgi:hypothetical protein
MRRAIWLLLVGVASSILWLVTSRVVV